MSAGGRALGGADWRVARPSLNRETPVERSGRPDWLKVRVRATPELAAVARTVRDRGLHTVCFSAACPNLNECWSRGTATFMIGGNHCTRRCGFCDVETARPEAVDRAEPERVAEAVSALGVRFAVVTQVARDDLPDGGAAQMAATVRAIRARCPGVGVEVLIADYKGDEAALRTVLDAHPDVLNHNLETVERLQRKVRPAAGYARSLGVLRRAGELRPDVPTKSGLILGMGEREDEIQHALRDLRAAGVTLLTLGQYLRPSPDHLPVDRWVTPAEFEAWRKRALALGFRDVASGPLVRSSYHAEQLADAKITGLPQAR
ncbi:MAG: lipoyl synthase [Myxococcota bacterium]